MAERNRRAGIDTHVIPVIITPIAIEAAESEKRNRDLRRRLFGEDTGDMVLVPKDPTAEMLEAGRKAWKKPRMHVNFQPADDMNTCGVIYRAMIEAKE